MFLHSKAVGHPDYSNGYPLAQAPTRCDTAPQLYSPYNFNVRHSSAVVFYEGAKEFIVIAPDPSPPPTPLLPPPPQNDWNECVISTASGLKYRGYVVSNDGYQEFDVNSILKLLRYVGGYYTDPVVKARIEFCADTTYDEVVGGC